MGVFDKAIPTYTINNRGGVVITRPEETPYIDDIFDPVFNKAVRDSLLERSNGSFGAAMVRGYGELLRNTFVGHNDQWGMFGPGMGVLSTFGRSMDKADDFILGAMTEAVRGLSGEKMQNPFTRIFRDDYDYTGKGLLAATTNLASPLVGGVRTTEDDFKGLWNVPAVALELATDPGVMGGAVSRRLLSKEARKASASDLLRNLGKADGKTRVGTAAKLLSDYDDFMSRVAIDVTAPGLRPLLRKIKHAAKQLFGANSANPYADTPLHDYRDAGSPPTDNAPDSGFDEVLENDIEPITPDMPETADVKFDSAIDDASQLGKKKKRGRPAKMEQDADIATEISAEVQRAYINAERRRHGEKLEELPSAAGMFAGRQSSKVESSYERLQRVKKEMTDLTATTMQDNTQAFETVVKRHAKTPPASDKNVQNLLNALDALSDETTFNPELVSGRAPAELLNLAHRRIDKILDDIRVSQPTINVDALRDALYDTLNKFAKGKYVSNALDPVDMGQWLQQIVYNNAATSSPHIRVYNSIRKTPEIAEKAAEGVQAAIGTVFDNIRLRGDVPYNARELMETFSKDPYLYSLLLDVDPAVTKDPLKLSKTETLAKTKFTYRTHGKRVAPETASTLDLYAALTDPEYYKTPMTAYEYIQDATELYNRVQKMADRIEKRIKLPPNLGEYVDDTGELVPVELDNVKAIPVRRNRAMVEYTRPVLDAAKDRLENEYQKYLEHGSIGDSFLSALETYMPKKEVDAFWDAVSSRVRYSNLPMLEQTMDKAYERLDAWSAYLDLQDMVNSFEPFLDVGANSPTDYAINRLLGASHIPLENETAFLDDLARAQSVGKHDAYRPRMQIKIEEDAPYAVYNRKAKTAADALDALFKARKPGEYWNNVVFELDGVKYTLGKPSEGVKSLKDADRLTYSILRGVADKNSKGYITGFSPYASEALRRFAEGDFVGFAGGFLSYTPDSVRHALGMAEAMQEAVSKGTMSNYYGVFEYNGKKYSIGSPDKLPKDVLSLQEAAPQTYNALTAMFERASTPGHGSTKYVIGFKPEVQALLSGANETFSWNGLHIPVKPSTNLLLGNTPTAIDAPKPTVQAHNVQKRVYNRDYIVNDSNPLQGSTAYLPERSGASAAYGLAQTPKPNPQMYYTVTKYTYDPVSHQIVEAGTTVGPTFEQFLKTHSWVNADDPLASTLFLEESYNRGIESYQKAWIAKAQDVSTASASHMPDAWIRAQSNDTALTVQPLGITDRLLDKTNYQLYVLQQLYNNPNIPDVVRVAYSNSLNEYARGAMLKADLFPGNTPKVATLPMFQQASSVYDAVPSHALPYTKGVAFRRIDTPKESFVNRPTLVYSKEDTVDAMADLLAQDPANLVQNLNTVTTTGKAAAVHATNLATEQYVKSLGDTPPDPEHLYSIGKLIDDAAAVVSKTKAGKSYHTERLQHLVDDLTKLREEKSPVYDQLKEVLAAADNASTDAVKGTDWVLDTIKSEIVNIPPDKITPEEFAKLTENVKKANTILGEDVFVLTYGKVGTLENVPMVTLDTTKEHATKLFKKHAKALTAEGALHDITYSVGIPADEVYKKYPEAKGLLDEYLACREEYYRLAGIPYSSEFITHVRSVDPEVAAALDHQLYGSFNAKQMADLSDMSNTLLQQVPEFREKTYGALGTTAYGRRFRGPASAWERIGITSKKKGKDGITYVKNHPVFKNDPIDVITGSFSMGTLHNSEFQSFVELFVNDNFKVKNYFKTPDELRNMFYDMAEDGRVGSNIDNLVLASPKRDATGKLIGFKKYANYTQAGLEAALKDENCVLLPVGAFSRLDAICKKDARMAHWWYRTVSKLTTPFKIGCLVNPGFLLGNASDAVLKQAVTMADQYGTSVTEELGNIARAYRDVQILNNRFAETFDRYIKDMEARGEKLLDTDRSYQSLLYSGTARKRFSEYCNDVYNITGSENMADILLSEDAVKHIPALNLIDVQVMQLWQYINGKLPTMKDNLQDLGDVAAQTRRTTGKYADQNVIERILYGRYDYDPKKPSTWGILSKNPLVEGVFAGSEYIEQSARASAILNDLRHRGMDLDALEQAMGVLHDKAPESASEAMHIRGMLEDALNAMNASNFDYDNVGPLLNAATYAMPFPTFYMKNIVFWMDLIENNPQMVKNLLKTHNAMWDVTDEEESDQFVAEAKGRGALAFGDVDSERPLRKFFKGIYKPTPMQSMFSAFNAVQHPIESLTSRVNPLVTAPLGAIAGELGGADSDLTALLGGTDSVKYRPYNTKRFQKNMRAGDKDFSGLRYMFHRINPFDRAINTALRVPEKAKHGELAISDIAPSVFQPRFK